MIPLDRPSSARSHPYLFFSDLDIEGLKKKGQEPVGSCILANMLRVADSRLSWEIYTPTLVRPFAGYKHQASENLNYDEEYARTYVEQYRLSMMVRNLPEFYSLCYVLTGKDEYLQAAKTWLLTPCRWSKKLWGAYDDSPLAIDEYTAQELRSLELSGGTCVAVRPHPTDERKIPVFEDTGIFTTFKLRGLAIAYDWLWQYLEEDERAESAAMLAYQGDRLYHHALNGNALLLGSILNHTWLDTAGLGLAGLALYYEHPAAKEWVQFCRDRFVNTLLPETIGEDGEFPEPCPYVWEYSYMSAAMFFEGLRRVTGEDLMEHLAFQRVARMLNRALTPTGGLAFDDDMMGFDRADGVAYSFRPLMFLFASRFKDAEAQRFALYSGFEEPGAERSKFYPGGRWFPERREYNGHWEYLWLDESVVPEDPSDEVPSTLFRSTGWAILRTGWCPEDTYMAFRSGPYLGHHDRFDQNKFVLQANGQKLLEHLYGANYLHFDYFKYTPGSNTILVNGEGQERVAEGGQHVTFMRQYKGAESNGNILFFDASPKFDAVVGDASHAYGNRLKRFVRYIAYIKPSVFLILDDLAAPEPSTFDWLAHTYGDITIEGNSVKISKGEVSLKIRSLLPGASWFLEDTPPDTNGERLRKHLALRPSAKLVEAHFLTALLLPPWDEAELPLAIERTATGFSAGIELGDESLKVEFDLRGKEIRVVHLPAANNR